MFMTDIQMILSSVFSFFEKCGSEYMGEIYFPAHHEGMSTRFSFKKLKIPPRKTTMGLRSLSYTAASSWNILPSSIKGSKSLNSFKHNLKLHFFSEMKKKGNI